MDFALYTDLQTLFEPERRVSPDKNQLRGVTTWNEVINFELRLLQDRFQIDHPVLQALSTMLVELNTHTPAEVQALAGATARSISQEGFAKFVDLMGLRFKNVDPVHLQPVAIVMWAQLAVELRNVLAGFSDPKVRNGSDQSVAPLPPLSARLPTSATEVGIKLAFDVEVCSYTSWQALTAQDDTALSDAHSRWNELYGNAQERLNQLSNIVIDLQSKDKELRDAIAISVREAEGLRKIIEQQALTLEGKLEALDAKADSLKVAVDTSDGNLAAFKTSAMEALRIDTARKLWGTRAQESRRAFIWSAIALAVFLLAIPIGALFRLDSVISALRHIGEVTVEGLPKDLSGAELTIVTISRLVVITVPLGLYFWLIRLIVKFNARSIALMDDARQRHTMMDTYFNLIEENAAVKEDRALILNALFRPTPGQSSDDVEPPNFIDLLSKGMGKG